MICDMGLARQQANIAAMTGHVATLWYRAPELLFIGDGGHPGHYNSSCDMWAVGCILAEMFTGRPLFPGNGLQNQAQRIFQLLGRPSPEVLAQWANLPLGNWAANLAQQFPEIGANFQLPNQQTAIPVEAQNLIKRCLEYNPERRITAADALQHPYFGIDHPNWDRHLELEMPAENQYVEAHDNEIHTVDEWKQLVRDEIPPPP